MRYKNEILNKIGSFQRFFQKDHILTEKEKERLETFEFLVVDKPTKSIVKVNALTFGENQIIPSDQENIDIEAELELSRQRGNL